MGLLWVLEQSWTPPTWYVFQQYLQKCTLKFITKNKFHMNVVSTREYYIYQEGEKYTWIFNPKWKIIQYIVFLEGKGHFVLTWNDHDGGKKLVWFICVVGSIYFHLKTRPTLPSRRATLPFEYGESLKIFNEFLNVLSKCNFQWHWNLQCYELW